MDFPEVLSRFPAPYEKSSLLWLLAKSAKKWHFEQIWCILMIYDENVKFESKFELDQEREPLSYNDV